MFSYIKGLFDKKFLLFSKEKINEGEEITIDYINIIHDAYLGSKAKFHCRCDDDCDKIIGENIHEEIKKLGIENENKFPIHIINHIL